MAESMNSLASKKASLPPSVVWAPRLFHGLIAFLLAVIANTDIGNTGASGVHGFEHLLFVVLMGALLAAVVYEYRQQAQTLLGERWHVVIYLCPAMSFAIGLAIFAPSLIPGGYLDFLNCYHYLIASSLFVGGAGMLCFRPLILARERDERRLADRLVDGLVFAQSERRAG